MTNLNAENLRDVITNCGKEIIEERIWGDFHSNWAEDFDPDQLRALLFKFSSFVDSSDHIQKNYMILGATQFVWNVDAEDYELAETLANDDWEVDFIDGSLYYSPESLYVYLGATEDEAWDFLIDEGLATKDDLLNRG